ncbi:MAG: hypothetical protein HUJ56_05700 [Erysipelotrichaceae bacterium]|nr:hypothetical protein [Erysipelotrichaceae bacterium]
MNKKTVIICVVAALCGLGVRFGINALKGNNPVFDGGSIRISDDDDDDEVEMVLCNHGHYYQYNEDAKFTYYDDDNLGFVEGSSSDVTDFPFEDWKGYVVEDNGAISDPFQDLNDNRSDAYGYSFKDYYVGYLGRVVFDKDSDGFKAIPRNEENSYDKNRLIEDLGLHYIQLDEKVTNYEELNQLIRDWALRGTYQFENTVSFSNEEGNELLENGDHFVEVFNRSEMYVTYNDDKYISIALFVQDERDFDDHYLLKSMIIDVQEGVVIASPSLIKVDEGLCTAFKDAISDEYDDEWYFDYMEEEVMMKYFKGEMMYDPIVLIFPDHYELGVCYGYNPEEIEDYDPSGFITVDVTDSLMEYLQLN